MKKRNIRIVSPIRFFAFVLIAVMLLVFGIYTVATMNTTEAATINTYRQVIVESNDTLWTIADEYSDDSKDVRDVIEELKEINDLTSDELQVGDVIFVPVS